MENSCEVRKRIYWNDDWFFAKGYEEGILQKEFSGEKLSKVRLPHTVVETPFHYYDEELYQMVSAYRRVFLPNKDWRGKRVLMTVEAAAHEAEIFLNGKSLMVHSCGYTAFTVDLAPYLIWEEENVLVIKVDSRESLNIPPFGHVMDYMTYGGIYREVYVDIVEPLYVSDVFTKVKSIEKAEDENHGTVAWECVISLAGAVSGGDVGVSQTLFDANGNPVRGLLSENADIAWKEGKGQENVLVGTLHYQVPQLGLWSPERPTLYLLQTILKKDGKVVDVREDRIGFRTVEAKQNGIFVNGKKIKLRGLNRHQSYPYVGYAMPKSMQRMDADILKKELGLNAVRTSHYPQSHHFLDRCDELGLLVFTEIPGWQHIGEGEWKNQAITNTEEMVLQYRNHPSIFLWGVRINESLDDDGLYTKTNETAHRLDDTRPTSGVRYLQKSSLLEDVYAYNDFSHDGTNAGCMKKKSVTPNGSKGYLISEYNGHMFPTKSFDCEDHRVEHMMRHAKVMDAYYEQEEIAGGFGWCMADYNTHKDFGSGDRICYHGVLDMFRNPKLAAALYAAQQEDEVVMEISSAMDIGEHPACLMKEVYAVTNADSVKLYKNEAYVGEFFADNTAYQNLPHGPILIDDFIGELMEKQEGFSQGKAQDVKKVLMAVNKYGMAHLPLRIWLIAAKCMLFRGMSIQDAYALYNKYVGNWGGSVTTYRFEAIKDGKVVKSISKQPMKTVKVKAEVSHRELIEESTYDVAAIRLQALSEADNLLPFYQEAIRFETSGDIEVIGPKMTAFKGGMCGTYVRSIGKKGSGILKISGEGFEPIEIGFETKGKVEA